MCQVCAPPRNRGKSKPEVASVAVPQFTIGGALDAVTAELTQAGMLDSHQGRIALGLARRFDDDNDSGAALAQVARQLRETMASALASAVPVSVDPLDELRAKRERRGSA